MKMKQFFAANFTFGQESRASNPKWKIAFFEAKVV